jgi:peptidyl-dipeptidase Dcp
MSQLARWLMILASVAGVVAESAAVAAAATFGPANPFFTPSSLPYHAPPFDRLKDEDYQPAIEAGMLQQRQEIKAIDANPAKPNFDNTLVALEKSGQLLARASETFSGVSQANTNSVLQAAKAALAPQFAAQSDAIYLDEKLFARVATVHEQRDSLNLDPESRRLLDYTYDQFVRAGAKLSSADKARLRKMNEELSTLSDDFSNKILAANSQAAFHTESRAQLAGLPDAAIAAAEQSAKARKLNGYLIPMQNTTQQPDFLLLQDRATRKAIFDNAWGRAERGDGNDTRTIIARLAQIRAQRAHLLGFPSHAAWQLGDQMAKTPQTALDFMDALVPLAVAKARREGDEIQSQIDAQKGAFKVEAWDWTFYGEQVRKARFDLDDAQIKPYFELYNVLTNGVFYAANQLYGITFTERKDIPVYQADVRVFEVRDADGKSLALFYCDYFKRDNKNGGAWMSNFVDESTLLGALPVIYNVANLPRPADGAPALISFDDVKTMFHEFGHALHGIFANTRYPSLSGANTPRDFVEFPSQFNEHWSTYPAVFDHYARHYKTGEVMPQALVEKMVKSQNISRGYSLTEILAAAELDMQWHLLAADAPLQNPDDFEKQALTRTHLDLPAVPPRYRSSYFSHIWGNGYSAGYYAYLWTQMLDDDAYSWFDEHGGLTRANGDRFRQMVLSRGNTEDLAALYVRWRGKPPTVDAMMKYQDLKPAAAAH